MYHVSLSSQPWKLDSIRNFLAVHHFVPSARAYHNLSMDYGYGSKKDQVLMLVWVNPRRWQIKEYSHQSIDLSGIFCNIQRSWQIPSSCSGGRSISSKDIPLLPIVYGIEEHKKKTSPTQEHIMCVMPNVTLSWQRVPHDLLKGVKIGTK